MCWRLERPSHNMTKTDRQPAVSCALHHAGGKSHCDDQIPVLPTAVVAWNVTRPAGSGLPHTTLFNRRLAKPGWLSVSGPVTTHTAGSLQSSTSLHTRPTPAPAITLQQSLGLTVESCYWICKANHGPSSPKATCINAIGYFNCVTHALQHHARHLPNSNRPC